MTVVAMLHFCFESRIVGFFRRVEYSNVYSSSATRYIGLPFLSSFVEAYTHKARRIITWGTSILRVTFERYFSEITQSVVRPHSVYVVDNERPVPMRDEPSKSVSRICSVEELYIYIPFVQVSGNAPCLSPRPSSNNISEFPRVRGVRYEFVEMLQRVGSGVFDVVRVCSLTPTRLCMSGNQGGRVRGGDSSPAVAEAEPSVATVRFLLWFYGDKSIKSLSCNIIKLRHRILQIVYGVRGRLLAQSVPSLYQRLRRYGYC